MKADELKGKKYMNEEKLKENDEIQDLDYAPSENKRKYFKKVALIQSETLCRKLAPTKKITSKKKPATPCDHLKSNRRQETIQKRTCCEPYSN